jgi:hypothetical protein
MADGGADQVARLDVVIGSPGSKESLDATSASLRANGEAAVENAQAVDASNAGFQRWRASILQGNDAAARGRQAMDDLTASQRQMVQAGYSLETLVAAANGSSEARTEILGKLSGATNDAAEANRVLAASTGGLNTSYQQVTDSTRAMTLAQIDAIAMDEARTRSMALAEIEAIKMNEAMDAGATSSGLQGLSLGRLTGTLGSAEARMAGMSGTLGRLTGVIGGNIVGFGQMAIALAVIGASVWAIEKLSGANSELTKQETAAAKALQDFTQGQTGGSTGKIANDLELASIKAKELRDAVTSGYSNSYGLGGVIQAFKDALGIGKSGAQQLADQDTLTTNAEAAFAGEIIRANGARQLQVDKETQLVAIRQAGLGTLEKYQGNSVLLANAAIDESAKVAKLNNDIEYHEKLLAATTQQQIILADKWKAGADALVDISTATARYNNYLKETADLSERVNAIAAKLPVQHQANDPNISNIGVQYATPQGINVTADIKQTQEFLNGLVGTIKEGVDPTVAWAASMALLKQNLLGTTAPAEKLSDTLKNDLFRAVDELSTHGLTSYTAFATEVIRLTQQMVKAIGDGKNGFGDLATALKGLNAGAAGGLIGFQLGGANAGNAGNALGLGAASGAAQGAQVAGVYGAIVGGLAGAVGGLLGAADAHKAAAKQLSDAAASLDKNLYTFANPGDKNAEGNAIANAQDQAAQFRTQAQTLLNAQIQNDKGNGDQALADLAAYQQRLGQINAGLQANLDLIAKAAALQSKDFAGALGVRNLQAAGLNDQATALAQSNKDADERAAVEAKYGQDSAEYASTVATQMAEAAKRAQDIAQSISDTNESYKLRAESAAGIDTFSQQQADELAKAIADGEDPSSIALLKIAQGNELLAHNQQVAKQQAQDQLTVLQQQQQTLQQSLTAQQQAVTNLQGVIANLKAGSDSLKLGSLSGLSPIQQLAEAKSQLDALVATAHGSDTVAAQAAANAVPAAITAFLTQSQNVNASGPGYVADYNYAQSIYTSLGDQFSKQLDVQQAILDTLNDSNTKLTAQILLLQQQIDATNASTQAGEVQQALQALQYGGAFNGATGNDIVVQLHQMGYNVVETNGQFSAQGFASGAATATQADIDAYNAILASARSSQAAQQSAATGSTTIPGYASGGDFSGGLHLVGEKGPELETTGASHITSNSDIIAMLRGANGDIVDELKSLRAEVTALRKQSAAGFGAVIDNTATTAVNTRDTVTATKQRDASASVQRSRNVGIA